MDTDYDMLTDDIDPRTWIYDHLPFSRIRGNADFDEPIDPTTVIKGIPFMVEGWVEINCTFYTGGDYGNWERAFKPMKVQVFLIQNGVMITISSMVSSCSLPLRSIHVALLFRMSLTSLPTASASSGEQF